MLKNIVDVCRYLYLYMEKKAPISDKTSQSGKSADNRIILHSRTRTYSYMYTLDRKIQKKRAKKVVLSLYPV